MFLPDCRVFIAREHFLKRAAVIDNRLGTLFVFRDWRLVANVARIGTDSRLKFPLATALAPGGFELNDLDKIAGMCERANCNRTFVGSERASHFSIPKIHPELSAGDFSHGPKHQITDRHAIALLDHDLTSANTETEGGLVIGQVDHRAEQAVSGERALA